MNLHYWTGGKDDAPLIVFTHGATVDHREWDPTLPVIGEQFRVLTWDVRGHGLSHPSAFSLQVTVKEDTMSFRKAITILVHAFVGWALCAATMGIGMATMSMQNALIVHAIGAPIFFTVISLIYFNKFNYTSPLRTALIFVGFVITVDFFVVALLINRSLEMFTSFLGTWIPFALIFVSSYLTGYYVRRMKKN